MAAQVQSTQRRDFGDALNGVTPEELLAMFRGAAQRGEIVGDVKVIARTVT